MKALAWIFVSVALLLTLRLAYDRMPKKSKSVQQLAGKDGRFVEVKGRRLHYTQHGRGKPIVLIHGFAGSTYTWRELIPLLAPKYTVYAVDLLGFGLSDKPADGNYSLSGQGSLIVDFIETLGLHQPAIAGHSMGGVIAALAVVQSPEKVGCLVLVDPGFYHGRPPGFLKYLIFPFDVAVAKLFYTKVVRTRSLLIAYYNQSLVTEELVDNYLKPAGTPGATAAIARMNKYSRERYDDLCGRIHAPTLLVWGRYDRIVPVGDAERVRGEVNGSLLALIDNAGHMVQEEKPQEVAAAIQQFLR